MISIRGQQPLWGWSDPSVGVPLCRRRRTELGEGAWVDYLPSWIFGHARLFDQLANELPWQEPEERWMYDRKVKVPRLLSTPLRGSRPTVLQDMADALSDYYEEPLQHILCAYYRSGQDSVAFHQDRVPAELLETRIAVVTLGGPRRFLLRRKGGGESLRWTVGWGDLLVMGGTCQQHFEHAVPKTRHAEPRMAVMFRAYSVEDPRPALQH